MTLVLRDVRPWGGAAVDLALADGRITTIGRNLPRGTAEIDGRGDVLLPGLHDHHLHILATAARRHSVDLTGLVDAAAVAQALVAGRRHGGWVRAVSYDERAGGLPDAALLDQWLAGTPLRLQDRTGALWALNSAALALLGDTPPPSGAERDAHGQPTGRFWREDQWLAAALPAAVPDLAGLGQDLAALGLTGLTDAGANNGPAEAALLVGKLPQRLVLMGSEALKPGAGYALGPLKLLIDERDPPALDALAARIGWARQAGRNVAAHCVTEAELALFIAALDQAGGARAGDRIEHGGMIPAAFIPVMAEAGLTVVTNPAFIHDRGDRYRATLGAEQWDELYRAGSLLAAGIALRAGSDAPYAGIDPWLGMRTARDRLTRDGQLLGQGEAIAAAAALALYAQGEIAVGASADLILCAGTMTDVLADLCAERVRATIIGGTVAFSN
ncbi:amidohydrolase family protein [Novosphingobium sp.]|uniref:amidohydrolase family protein n=1 Tax=Novosphingobium sp. TaxID=1874826 RepID=UPI002735862A|nr:amidohydrolase family protein [Novosphingobium sp.]MDP3905989.1 amidohydrolase family protein [Novosphingobium sp.]